MENTKEKTEVRTKSKVRKFLEKALLFVGAGALVYAGATHSEQVKTFGRKCGNGMKTVGGKLMSCCHRKQQQQPTMEQQNLGYQQQYQPRYNNRGEFNNNKH